MHAYKIESRVRKKENVCENCESLGCDLWSRAVGILRHSRSRYKKWSPARTGTTPNRRRYAGVNTCGRKHLAARGSLLSQQMQHAERIDSGHRSGGWRRIRAVIKRHPNKARAQTRVSSET